MLREVVHKSPVEVFVHVAERMALLRQHEHVETLSGADQSLNHTHRVTRMDIVVDIAMNKKQMALELRGDLRIGRDLINECSISLLGNLLLHSVVGLALPAVVDVVVMVSGT